MEISHEQAHRLIQRNLDTALGASDMATLLTHLRNCRDCQAYEHEMKHVEEMLKPLLERQWNRQPIPLPASMLTERKTRQLSSPYLSMRNAAVSLVFGALLFSAWQFFALGPAASTPVPFSVPHMPTPGLLTAQVTGTTEICAMMTYTVEAGDSLDGIAERFGREKEELMELNGLSTDAVGTSTTLIVPVCGSTPTGTVHPVTFTTTFTPRARPTTSTPGW